MILYVGEVICFCPGQLFCSSVAADHHRLVSAYGCSLSMSGGKPSLVDFSSDPCFSKELAFMLGQALGGVETRSVAGSPCHSTTLLQMDCLLLFFCFCKDYWKNK